MNKEGKKDKDKKKNKAMMATQSDRYPSLSESNREMEIKANLCLMEKDDGVCLDDIDDFDALQNEYERLFKDFEKLRCHNGFPLDLARQNKKTKIGVATIFLSGCDQSPENIVPKLGFEILI